MESSSTTAYPPLSADLLCNQHDLLTLLHSQASLNPAVHEENMLPNSSFGSAHTFHCAGFGIPQHALADVDSRSWIDKNLSYALSHGLSKGSDPLLLSKLPSHGQIPKESCVEQMMASLTRNGGVNEVVCANSSMQMTQILPKLGSLMHNAVLTVDPSKVVMPVYQDVHVPAPSMGPELTKGVANLSGLSKQASFTSSSQLAQVAANSLWGNGVSGLTKAGSQENLTRLPSGLHTLDKRICTGTNIANGCRIGLQGAVKQTITVSPNACAISQIKGEPTSMDNSDENFGQEASSLCATNGGSETTTERVNKGKKKRVKDQSTDGATQFSSVKNSENDGVKKGKRHKSGEETSEEDQKVEAGNSTPSSGKDSSKPPEPSKPDYIHVRARRGQATDSHSLAERVRREKISERMKFLQDLVPGCSKVTGKALMLDEIINYVQSLQRQVEFLSMKFASVNNPMLDFHLDGLFGGEIIQPQAIEHKAVMMSEESITSYLPYLHFSHHASMSQQMGSPNPFINVHSVKGLDIMEKQSFSTSLASMDSNNADAVSQLTQAWEEELQHVLQGRPAPAPSTSSSFQGQWLLNGTMKIEL